MEIALWESRRENGMSIDVRWMTSGEHLCSVSTPPGSCPDQVQISGLKSQINEQAGIPVYEQRLFSSDGTTELAGETPYHVFGQELVVRLVQIHDPLLAKLMEISDYNSNVAGGWAGRLRSPL